MVTLNLQLVVAFLEITTSHAALQVLELLDLRCGGCHISEHPADPSVGNIRLANCLGSLARDVLRLLLGTDEEDLLAACHCLANDGQRRIQRLDRLSEVDDVTILPLTMNIWCHLRMPPAGLVPKMSTGFKQSLDICLQGHIALLLFALPHTVWSGVELCRYGWLQENYSI